MWPFASSLAVVDSSAVTIGKLRASRSTELAAIHRSNWAGSSATTRRRMLACDRPQYSAHSP